MDEQKNETLASWAEVAPKDGGEYFKPSPDKSYRVRFASVQLVRKQFQNTGSPRLTAVCKLAALNGEPSSQVFETKSFTILRGLHKHVEGETWKGAFITFFLKKKVDGDKTTYIFEELPNEAK